MNPTRVLVVDDDPVIREVLERYLRREGYEVDSAADGDEAVAAFKPEGHDLVVLDVMMPGVDGIEILKWIRQQGSTPAILLTARTGEADRIAGLELGADDYVVKPFSPGEVIARVRAVLRRSSDQRQERIAHGDLTIDAPSRRAYLNGTMIDLTPKEFDLLYFLASHPSTVFSRVALLEKLWDFAFEGDPSTVTVHIRRLREKIEEDPSSPRHLVTVWGAGYRFDP